MRKGVSKYLVRIACTGALVGCWAGWGTGALAATALTDGRQYELVSPPNKGGGDVMADSSRTRAASDGNAASFSSLAGFGDVHGTGIATEYLSVRAANAAGSSGWSTHAITPRQDPLTLLGAFQAWDPLWEGELSGDLSRGVFRAWSPLTDAPSVAKVENLYLRDDLRAGGAGSYRLLSDCPACGSSALSAFNIFQIPRLAGASTDFSHVIFESALQLTSDASPGNRNLYEWTGDGVRLAGILPDGTTSVASIAGKNASGVMYAPHTISNDGRRIIFTDDSATGGSDGQLYERIDGESTVQVNAVEGGAGAGPATATYWDASGDGTRIFFTTGQQLIAGDLNGAVDLYLWDANAAAGRHLTLVSADGNANDAPNDVLGAMGSSADGHYVYFAASGQLVPGEPVLDADVGIFVWHDGTTSYIGQMAIPGADEPFDLPGGWGLGQLRSRVTPDGRHLLFMSHSGTGLTAYDQSACGGAGCTELYVYSVDAASDGKHLHCASCNPSGAPATKNADDTVRNNTSASDNTWHLNHPLAADGHWVFFSTAEALVSQDTNGRSDVYQYDTQTGTVHLISQGTDQTDAYFTDASASGQDVFFLTQQQLVGWDTDGSYDLYDARVGGGFPDPVPVSAPCVGGACHGPQSSAPSSGALGSGTAVGNGNVKRTAKPKPRTKLVKCKHGFARKKVKGKVKCVKKRPVKHTARKASKRRAGR